MPEQLKYHDIPCDSNKPPLLKGKPIACEYTLEKLRELKNKQKLINSVSLMFNKK